MARRMRRGRHRSPGRLSRLLETYADFEPPHNPLI